tara:strand:+ start:4913 stop:5314 length:402 start_codon:yes stop_codon:yes gene_type:complete
LIKINFGEILKIVGPFISKNWQMIGLIFMIILFFMTRNDYAALKKSMDVMNQSYEEQLDFLQSLHEEEIKKRDSAIALYEQILLDMEENHKEDLEAISSAKEKDIRNNIKNFEEQPEELAQEIESLFGFEYVK